MCKRLPGPRCASHAKTAMNAALKDLNGEMERPGATQSSIHTAKKAYDEAVGIYDSTPTGQKKITEEIALLESKKFHNQQENNANKVEIRAAKTRLNRAIMLRASHVNALAQLEEKEATIVRIDEALAEGKKKDDFAYRYQRDVGNVLASRGNVVSDGNGWGGEYMDYRTSDHLQKCGAKFTEGISESGSINSYDTFSERTTFGLEANVTCNCNGIVQRKVFLANESMSSLIRYFDEDVSSEPSQNESDNWWREQE